MPNKAFNTKIEAVSNNFPDLMRNLQSLTYQTLPMGESEEEQLCADLSLSQMRCLGVFLCDVIEPLKMSDVAKKLNVSLPTVTQIVEKLVDLGLLERVKDDGDRRLVLIKINDKGRRLVKMAQERRKDSFKIWLEKLNQSEQEELVALLEKIMAIFAKVNKIEREEERIKKESK